MPVLLDDSGVPLKGVGSEHLRDKLILPSHLSSGAFAGVGVITAIDPDDAGLPGTTGLIADAGHQHLYTAVAPSALTRTVTSTEGSSSNHVRADHGHATDQLAWGILNPGRQILTSNSTTYTTNTTTDFSIANVVVDVARLYEAHLHAEWLVSAGAYWEVRFHVGGTNTERLDAIQTTVAAHGHTNANVLWLPSSGTVTVDVRVVEMSAGGDLTFEAASTASRQFWVEDIGPR